MIKNTTIAQNCQYAKLRSASRTITRLYDDAMRPLNLNANQFTLLVGVSLAQPVSVTHLANELNLDRTTLTRNLVPLEKSGYLSLHQGHGRTRNIMITQDGRELLEQAKPEWEKIQSIVIDSIGIENIHVMNAALKKIGE